MSIVIEYLACAFDAFIGVYFITKFCKSSLKNNIPAYATMFAVFTASVLLLYIQTNIIIELLIDFFIKLIYSLSIKKCTFIKRIISPIIYSLVLILVNTIILVSITNIFSLNMADIASTSFWGRYLYIIACKIIMTTILMIILRLYKFGDRFTITDLILYLIFPIVTVITLYIFIKLGIEHDLSKYSVLIITSILGLCVINILTLVFFKRANDNASAKLELELIKSRNDAEKDKYEEMGILYENLRIARHDIKDQLLSIKEMLHEKKYDSVNDYIIKQEQEIEKSQSIFHTGNRIIDYIIYSKVNQNNNLTFFITGEVCQLESISDMDLATLFGNILSNAIEAATVSTEKRVEVLFKSYKNYQSIICNNSVDKPVLPNNPDLKTTKSDTIYHGLGVKSIKRIAEQNHGLIEFYEENHMFCVHVAFPIKINPLSDEVNPQIG